MPSPLAKLRQRHRDVLEGAERWYALRLLALYRLFILVLLLSLAHGDFAPVALGDRSPALFAAAGATGLALALLWLLLIHLRRPEHTLQAQLQVLGDIAVGVLLMHASGGVASGLGILLVVNVAAAALILSQVEGLFFAALASLAVLGEAVYTDLLGHRAPSYPQAAALGAAFFGVTLLLAAIKRRLLESERIAEQRELDLANLGQLNEHIVQHMDSGVIVVDPAGTIRLINAAARLQLNAPDLAPSTPLERLSADLASRLTLWREAPEQPVPRLRSPGNPFELQPRFTPLGPGGRAGTLILLEDTTPYSREFQNMKLASLGRLTASIAHEIRNPLSAIRHAAQLLAEAEQPGPQERRLIEIILQQSERINGIIDNILQLSVKRRGEPVELELAPWLRELAEEFASRHGDALVELDLDLQPGASALVDPGQLHQIVWNLCSNALRHGAGPDGRLQLTLGCAQRPDGGAALFVADRGPGVPPALQDKIFEPFFSGGAGGSGLGLYIVRELCAFNGAQIQLQTRPGGGALFRIDFPSPRQAAAHWPTRESE
ncbi:MAG: sensor protein PilS [Gammaproteobacteria bacterium]|nr:MAG: sensor protein PilS [Gammaproteobacteria bacterium]